MWPLRKKKLKKDIYFLKFLLGCLTYQLEIYTRKGIPFAQLVYTKFFITIYFVKFEIPFSVNSIDC